MEVGGDDDLIDCLSKQLDKLLSEGRSKRVRVRDTA
jgi:hypothetical protein